MVLGLVRRQNAFEHLIRIFRFLAIQVRCGKRQDTIPTNVVYATHGFRFTLAHYRSPSNPLSGWTTSLYFVAMGDHIPGHTGELRCAIVCSVDTNNGCVLRYDWISTAPGLARWHLPTPWTIWQTLYSFTANEIKSWRTGERDDAQEGKLFTSLSKECSSYWSGTWYGWGKKKKGMKESHMDNETKHWEPTAYDLYTSKACWWETEKTSYSNERKVMRWGCTSCLFARC